MVEVGTKLLSVMNTAGRQVMETPQDVAQMMRLQGFGNRHQGDRSLCTSTDVER